MTEINLITAEGDLFEYEIINDAMRFQIQCYLYCLDDILLLTGVDVEGPGQNTLQDKVFRILNEVCQEFCKLFKTKKIIVLGAKRTRVKQRELFSDLFIKDMTNFALTYSV